MHHLPAVPSRLERLAAILRRRSALMSGLGVCATVAVVVLGLLFSAGGRTPADDTMTVDASSDAEPRTPELETGSVRLGVDGAPAGGSASGSPAAPTGTSPGTSSADTASPGAPAPDTTAPGTGAGRPGPSGATPPGSSTAGDTTARDAAPGSAAPGTPAAGTPSVGTPSAGTPSAGSPPAGSPPAGTPTPAATPSPGATPSAPVSPPTATVPLDESPPATRPAGAPAAGGRVEAQVLALVDRERAAAGCGAMVADRDLAAVARAHSADMRDRGFFDHTNPDQQDPFERAAAAGLTARAENIARGQADAAAVMAAWMASPGHRANILDCDLTRLGVGVVEGAGGPWWTQVFA